MFYVFGKINCCFCNGKDGVIHSICEYGIYGDGDIGKRIFYHPECLEMVETDPEKWGHKMVDKALHIGGLKERNCKQCNHKLVEVFEKKCEQLSKQNFERMMPKG